MVMGPGKGGPFAAFDRLVAQGLGGPMAGGGMMMSWIHLLDFCRAVEWFSKSELDGPVNVCSPNPLTNRDFMRAIVNARRVKIALPVAKWMVILGAIAMKTEPELPLKSRWAVPRTKRNSWQPNIPLMTGDEENRAVAGRPVIECCAVCNQCAGEKGIHQGPQVALDQALRLFLQILCVEPRAELSEPTQFRFARYGRCDLAGRYEDLWHGREIGH